MMSRFLDAMGLLHVVEDLLIGFGHFLTKEQKVIISKKIESLIKDLER